MPPLFIAAVFTFLTSFVTYSQLTGVTATLIIDSAEVQSIDSVISTQYNLITEITPNDLSDLGKLSIVIYDAINESFVYTELVKTKQQLLSENQIIGNSVRLNLMQIFPGSHMKVVISPQAVSDAYAEETILFQSF